MKLFRIIIAFLIIVALPAAGQTIQNKTEKSEAGVLVKTIDKYDLNILTKKSDWMGDIQVLLDLDPPTLTYPDDGATGISQTATLDWDAVSLADSYTLEISDNSGFSSTLVSESSITVTEYTIPDNTLDEYSTYYWRVKSVNSDTESDWVVRSFVTGSSAPPPLDDPTLTNPDDAATDVDLTVTLDWDDVTNADSYNLDISIYSDFSSTAVSQTGLTSSEYSLGSGDLNGGTTYYWRVQAENNSDQSDWSSRSFTTVSGSGDLDAPVLTYPTDGATDITLTPTLTWDEVDEAEEYEIELSTESDFSSTVFSEDGLEDTEYAIGSGTLENGTTYFWRVKALNSDGESLWSDASFTTESLNPPPDAPVLVSPDDLATGVSMTPTMDWVDDTEAASWEIEISESSDFSSTELSEDGITSSEYTVDPGTLEYLTLYYWRVRAINVYGESDWSSRSFTTIPEPLDAPTLTSPDNLATGISLTPALDWDDVDNATSYDVQISASADFSSPVVDETAVLSSGYTVSSGVLSFITQYYWRVRAVNANTESDWSSRSFTTEEAGPPPDAPNLMSPSNWAWNISVIPTLEVSNVSGASYYSIQIAEDRQFNNLVLDQTNILTNTFDVPEDILKYRGRYYWRASVTVNGQTSEWSGYYSFRTLRLRVELVSPENSEQDVSLAPTFTWEDAPNVQTYRLQVSTNRWFSDILLDESGLTSNEYTMASGILEFGENYFWRVAGVSYGEESRWSNFSRFFTITIGRPELLEPSHRENDVSLNPTFEWSSVNLADTYILQVSTSIGFWSLIKEVELSATEYELTDITLDFGTRYFWRVCAKIGDAQGDWSDRSYFSTERLDPPSLVSPSNNARDIELTPEFEWENITGATSYNLQVSTRSNFRTLVYETEGISGNTYELPSGELNYNSRYYWRVSLNKSGQTSDWSNDRSFRTRRAKASETDIAADNGNIVSLYPNPVVNSLKIYGEFCCEDEIVMKVTDLQGRVLKTMKLGITDRIERDIDVSKYAQGTYFIRIEYGNDVLINKFIKE